MKALGHLFKRFEIWPVILLIAGAILSDRLLPWAAGGLAAVLALRVLFTGRLAPRTPIDWPAALLLALLPVTLWASADRQTTLLQVLRLLVGVAGFYAITGWANTPGRLRLTWWGLGLVGIALAAAAPFLVEWSPDKLPLFSPALYQNFRTLTTNPANPNVVAGFLAALAPLPLAALLFAANAQPRWVSLLAGLGALGMVAILVLTQSRGAWLGFAAGLALLAALRWRRAGAVAVALLAVVAVIALLAGGPHLALDWLANEAALNGSSGRVEIWSRAIFMIQDFPFTGIGMGTFGRVADLLYPFFGYEPGSIPHAHNLFLQVAVDLGIPGLVSWLAIGMLAAWMVVQVFLAGSASSGRAAPGLAWDAPANLAAMRAALGAALLAGSLGMAVHGLTDAVTWGMVRPAPLIWLLWGLGAAAFLQLEAGRQPQ